MTTMTPSQSDKELDDLARGGERLMKAATKAYQDRRMERDDATQTGNTRELTAAIDNVRKMIH